MDVDRVLNAFRHQIDWCYRLGSELYGRLIEVAVGDIERGGPVAELLHGWEGAPGKSALPLRLLGGVHHLVLTGAAPGLAQHYPSAGGSPAWPDAGQEFLTVVESQTEAIRPWLHRHVQTNEVNRSAVLLGGLLEVAHRTGRPLRVRELGASAGLNLHGDRYRYHLGVGEWGPAHSEVHLTSAWSGATPDLATPLRVLSWEGCDPHPIDAEDPDQAARLRAFVWPDHAERLTRLTAALRVATVSPRQVAAMPAGTWLPGVLAHPAPGEATVVMHSVVWQYIPPDEQSTVVATIEEAARDASPREPLAWLRMEPERGVGMQVRLRLWPDGEDVLLGSAHAHGANVEWVL